MTKDDFLDVLAGIAPKFKGAMADMLDALLASVRDDERERCAGIVAEFLPCPPSPPGVLGAVAWQDGWETGVKTVLIAISDSAAPQETQLDHSINPQAAEEAMRAEFRDSPRPPVPKSES